MRLIVPTLAIALLTGCVSYDPTFPSVEGTESEMLHVVPVLHQEEVAVQVVVADSSASTAQYGAIGALIGAIVDSAINNSRAKKAERKAEVLRASTVDYDLRDNFSVATATESEGPAWTVLNRGTVTADTDSQKLIEDAFADTDVDTVVLLTGTYQLTPAVDQVYVSIDQQVFSRSKVRSSGYRPPVSTRHIGYQSPSHAIELRPFRDGEKELVQGAIRLEYEQAIATQPDEEETLRKAMAQELEEIEESTVIPEDRAIAETWSPELLARYLDQARTHLRYMLELDWNETVKPDMPSEDRVRFFAVTPSGSRLRLSGHKVGNLDQNDIYRMTSGTLYSVPPADE